MVKLPKIKLPRPKFPQIKFKGVGKKKFLVIGGAVLLAGGLGASGWYFLPNLGLTQRALSLVGLGHGKEDPVVQTDAPHSQSDHQEAASGEQVPVSFSAQSQLVLAVRAMLNQQTDLAYGKPGAGAKLKASMSIISTMVKTIDVRRLTTQEYDAVAVYVLSGGRPEILERIAAEDKLDPERQNLFEGAIAFVRADMKIAAAKLANVHPAKFEPVLAARIHMLQAHLDEKAPYEARFKNLEIAVNSTLGTLLEEAATRRMVALAGENAVLKDFYYWADRYQRRFPYSPYYPDFWADVMKTVFSAEKSTEPLGLTNLHGLLLHVPEDRKLTFVRTLILRSIKEGYPRLCHFGLDEASATTGRSGEVVEKLRLYRLACAIGERPDEVAQQLALLDRSKLDANEIELLEAASALAQGILADGSGPEKLPDTYGPQPGYAGVDLVNARAASVAQQIDATDSVLKRVQK